MYSGSARIDRTGRAANGYSVYDAGSHGQGASVGVGAGRTYGAAQGKGSSAGSGGHREHEYPRALGAESRERCGRHQYGAPLRPWRYERAA
eukprot:4585116-Pleurochrysis_carterae.AAC.1